MRSFSVAILLTGLLCLTLASRAGAFPGISSPGTVTGGESVRTVVPKLPAGAREFELELVLDDGSERAVSPELPAGVTVVTWRVPNVPVRGARLRLRVGGEHWERELALSNAFDIRADAHRPADERVTLAWSPGPIREWMTGSPRASLDLLAADDAALVEPDDGSPGAPLSAAMDDEPGRDPYAAPGGIFRTPSFPTRTVSVRLRI